MLLPWGKAGFWYSFSLLSVKSTDYLPSCWMLDLDVAYKVSWQIPPSELSLVLFLCTQNSKQLKFQISFYHYQAYNNFTAQQSHYNELREAIKASFLWRDLHEYKKDCFLTASNHKAFQQRCHIGFVVCQKSLQEASVRSSNQHASTWQKLMGLNWYGTPLLHSHFKSSPQPETQIRISWTCIGCRPSWNRNHTSF